MKPTHTSSGRWYEKDPDIAGAFEAIENMPEHYRQIIAQVIVGITQRLKAQNRGQGLISIGSDRIMGLMKAQQKRRKIDLDKLFHKAHTNLFILPDDQRNFMAERIYISVICLNEYFEICDRQNKIPDLRELASLINEAMDKGLRAAEKFMISRNLFDHKTEVVFQSLYRRSSADHQMDTDVAAATAGASKTAQEEPSGPKQKARIKSTDEGLRIRKQDPN